MSFFSAINKAFFEGYANSEISISIIFACVFLTACISCYICILYKMVNRNSFYDRSFRLSLFTLSIITSMVILTIQSNIVVSLGMVGALSIVRFRTAIKNPMDLAFLFWSISVGIICGAGFSVIAVAGSIVLSIGILFFYVIPSDNGSILLVINSKANIEKEVVDVLKRHNCRWWKVRSRSYNVDKVNISIELKIKYPEDLMNDINENLHGILNVNIIEHDGDITI